jgi:hypothetical protein
MAKKSPKKGSDSSARPRAARRTEPVYTVITFVTFVAMAIGCALLYLDFDEYGKTSPQKENIPALPKLGDETKAGAGGTTAPKGGAATTDGM